MASLVAIVMTAGLLAACSTVPPRTCPSVGVLSELDSVALAGPGEPQARVIGIRSQCDYDGTRVDVEVEAILEASAGGDYGGGSLSLDYLLAMVDPDGIVVAKTPYRASISLPPGGGTRRVVQTIEQQFPLASEFDSAAGIRLLLGFETAAGLPDGL